MIDKKEFPLNDDGWDDDPNEPVMTPEEAIRYKSEADAEMPDHFGDPETGRQWLVYADGTEEDLTPDHPLYNHWYGT